MAGWGRSGTQAAQPLEKTTETRSKGTRRKFSLIVITSLLNVLLWSSLLCIATSLYQIISEPKDTSIYAQVVLDITSAFAAVAYTLAHTIFSVKQKSWDQQQRPTSSVGRASNIALRMAALLCALWLLTMGWNMILVARRPVCSQRAEGLGSWEYGTTCLASRVGIITASIALGVSCALFGILAKVSRPLEAHLFNHGYQPPIAAYSRPYNPRPSTSHSRSQYFGDNFEPQERPLSMRGADESNSSTADVRMIDPAERPGSSSNVSGQFTARPGDPEVFTSHHKPPPIPAEYITPQRKPWPGVSAPVHPSHRGGDSSTSSSRSSSPNGSSGSRQILPAQSSESALRAAHPNPESLALVTRSRSQKSRVGFSYQNPYSRSSIALTRPKRLSYASSGASMSSRNRLSRSDSRDSSRRESSAYERAGFDEVARALVKGIPVPSIAHPSHRAGSIRITTKLDTNQPHDTTYMTGALAIPSNNGGLSREPSLNGSEYEEGSEEHRNYVRSTSPGYSMLFSPDNSPTDDVNPNEIQKPVSTTPIPRKPSPARRRDSVRSSSALTAAEAARAMINNLPQDLPLPKHESARAKIKPGRSREFEEMKNKPLPRIAYI